MTFLHVLLLVCFAFLLATAQIILKSGVAIASQQAQSFLPMITALLGRWQFWSAMMLCGSLVLLWSWLLSIIPLSKAYPFVVLAFVFASLMEHWLYGQRLSLSFFLGCLLILGGLLVIARQ